MKELRLSAAVLFCSLAFAHHARGEGTLRFAKIFGNHMVLQQQKPARVWGWAHPGAIFGEGDGVFVVAEEWGAVVGNGGRLGRRG